MNYSFLDPTENVSIPPPMINAGLYAPDIPYKPTKWSKDYRVIQHLEPDAVSYASQFNPIAKNHIPTGVRPGNNTILNNPYNFFDKKFNTMCYNAS